MKSNPTIVIAGASGYIGREIIPKLFEKFPDAKIIALSRSKQKSVDPRLIWQPCDLFSLKSLELALPETIDFAIYLVHSMEPTAQLDQGSFADYDLILADNFARLMKSKSLKQLIYLSGLIPEMTVLSLHLQSRLEVEETFAEYGLPTTIFRAGLILGEAGSSFQILTKLVQRLPIMICPHWTQTLTTPVDLNTVLSSLVSATSDLTRLGKVYDLAGCKPLTYIEMMNVTAQEMGYRRLFWSVPFFTPTLSRLWVSLITNSSKNLVYPLVDSLQHPMIARTPNLFSKDSLHLNYRDILKKISLKPKSRDSLVRFRVRRRTVRSVQRLALPKGKNAEWVKSQYLEWLPRFFSTMIRVEQRGETTRFSILNTRLSLLELQLSKERSNSDRQLLYVTKGLLVSKKNRGRLEFRVVLNRRYVLAAIHDFKPSLPWFIYKYTQAKLHLVVMKAFSRHITDRSD